MANVVNNGSVSIAQLKANMSLVMHNPTLVLRRVLEHLGEVSSQSVNIVDPSNPFVFLLESNAVSTSAAVDEYNVNMRALYSKLSVNEQDLYNHMSDVDYAGRFATCAQADFYFVFGINELKSKGYVYAPYADSPLSSMSSTVYKDTYLPKGSFVYIDGYTFTLEHGIYIRLINDTQLIVFFDTNYTSPLSVLDKSIIEYEIRKDNAGAEWLYFKAPMLQIQDSIQNDIVHRSALFVKTYAFSDSFYFLRAFYRSSSSVAWNEFSITYSDIVFDSTVPTLLVKIIGSAVQVSMPLIYNTGLGIDGEVAIHIFTTKGAMAVDLSTYLVTDYVLSIKDVYGDGDPAIRSKEYESTNAAIKMQAFSFSTDIVTSGSNGVTFDALRSNVINQTLGDRKLPITNVQLSSALITNNGFEIISNTDVLTNRVFLAVKRLPSSVFELIKTAANIGIAATTFNLTPGLATSPNLRINGDRATLLSNSYFKELNGIVTMMDQTTMNLEIIANPSLTEDAVIANFNNNRYFYNPFHYVLDTTGNDFSIRAYNLDDPIANNISFEKADRRSSIAVYTSNYALTKSVTGDGYTLSIVATGTTAYMALVDADFAFSAEGPGVGSWNELLNAQVQVSIFDEVKQTWAYFKPKYMARGTDGKSIIFECDFVTNYDIDSNDLLCLTNACIAFNNSDELAYVKLGSRIRITHLAMSAGGDAMSDFDGTYNLNFLTNAVTRTNFIIPYSSETLYTEFGTSLKNLWSRARSTSATDIYQTYPADVPVLYTQDVYDPVTPFTINAGVLTWNVIHTAGSVVAGHYLHRAGDIKLDGNNNPLLDPAKGGVTRTVDLFFVDAKYLKGNTAEIIAYRNEIRRTIVTWITVDLITLQGELLEQTSIYFYPKTTLSKVSVFVSDTKVDLIDAEQSLIVDLYVSTRVANDASVQKDMYGKVIATLDNYIALEAVSISDIIADLKNQFGTDVKGIKISGLGGAANDYQLVYTKQSYNRLCLKKKVIKRPNNLVDVIEDVTINFINIEKLLA